MRLKKNNCASVIFLRTLLLFAFLFFPIVPASADPLNFMVGPLTFERPTAWAWKDPDPSTKAAAELRIVDATTHAEAQVLFSFSSSEPESIIKRWKGYFAEPPPVDWKITTNKVQTMTVTYLTVTGTRRSKTGVSPGCTLFGAIVQTEKGTVYGRLLGPKNMVQELTAEFKKMVEAALTEN